MDSRKRTWAKAVFWQILGLFSMLAVGYGFTGSFRIGGTMALVNAGVGLMAYVVYERVWAGITWGRRKI